MIDPSNVIQQSRENGSNVAVKTARYMIEVVMNEENPDADDKEHRDAFANEFQRALDDGYFEELRYNLLLFEVVSREVLDEAPAGDPEV